MKEYVTMVCTVGDAPESNNNAMNFIACGK